MLDVIRSCEVFQPLSAQAQQKLADLSNAHQLRAGEVLFRAGQPCDRLYLIASGHLDVVGMDGGRERTVSVVGEGQLLGTHAPLGPSLHGVTARASAPATLVFWEGPELRALLASSSELAAPVLTGVGRIIAGRLRFASGAGSALYPPGGRMEHDLLGDREVPADALYGVQTLRALENFDVSSLRLSHFPSLIKTLAQVKQACARANGDLGLLTPELAQAIDDASQDLIDGRFHGHFVVDMMQGGAGTSTNMNANEVIANRALERLGRQRGDYEACHPNNHVNLSQSTNDVYPTALRLATLTELVGYLESLRELCDALQAKAVEFADVVKMGRTQLQDAVPMTLGQEFRAFAVTLGEDILRLQETSRLFHEVNLGGTAIGTGINTEPEYADKAVAALRELSGFPLVLADDLVEATPDTGAFVMFHGVLKRNAVKLSKMCNDLRLLSSGPRCGLGEIILPPVQPGSSIMPGKVNPVIPELVNQVAFRVIGNDITLTMAAEAGQLQLNVMEPVIAMCMFESMSMLDAAVRTLTSRCIRGIRADEERCKALVDGSIGLITATVPYLGYERAGEVARQALSTGERVRDILLSAGDMDEATLDKVLSVRAMTAPRSWRE